ncbi:MAG: hypothetical protein U5K56_02595 [Halioglobus sp.]|nr:hypothetical protein [Halioglobus sp.]
MYRYSVDNAVTYTPNDLILFRQSPFATWMERLTLENPDHGIPPDVQSSPPGDTVQSQEDLVDSLRAEGRDVVLVNWKREESRRRSDTLDAIRQGADFIVNGMLALGSLCGPVDMLMRTSGYSDLGDFLYIPCSTRDDAKLDAAFRLCFHADLLHSLQGQLPPQILLIREGAEVVPLQTDDHIYYYRAVKQRFLDAMGGFRKHRMPDPAESAHFGRWSDCASEVLKQRAQSAEFQRVADQAASEAAEEEVEELEMPRVRAAGAGGQATAAGHGAGIAAAAQEVSAPVSSAAPTLAEQARSLSPDAFKNREGPGRTPNLAQFPISEANRARRAATDAASDVARGEGTDALKNLAFIGSSEPVHFYDGAKSQSAGGTYSETAAPRRQFHPDDDSSPDSGVAPPVADDTPHERADEAPRAAVDDVQPPAPELRSVPQPPPEPMIEGYEVELIDLESLDLEPREPLLLPPDEGRGAAGRRPPEKWWDQNGVDSDRVDYTSAVDPDSAPPPALTPVKAQSKVVPTKAPEDGDESSPGSRPFSDSLITNEDFDSRE